MKIPKASLQTKPLLQLPVIVQSVMRTITKVTINRLHATVV